MSIINLKLTSVAIVVTLLVAVLVAPVIPTEVVAAQEAANETTATTTATEMTTTTATTTAATTANSGCVPDSSAPSLSQSRLYSPDQVIEPSSPGRIAGGFQVDPTVECPVVVYITMSVPSGMTIEGSSDIASAGAGMATARFTVRPGANVKDIAARVYSEETGKRTVTADITYWPVGHKDMAREIDGLSFTYEVEEPATPTQTRQTTESVETNTPTGDDEKDLIIDTPGFGVSATAVALLGALFLLRRQ